MARVPGWILAAAALAAAIPGRSEACNNAVLATDEVIAALGAEAAQD